MKTSDNVDEEILTYDFKPELYSEVVLLHAYASVGIDLKELGGGSAAEMFEILPRDSNLKPIFTQKWASVDMNWGFNPQPPRQFQP